MPDEPSSSVRALVEALQGRGERDPDSNPGRKRDKSRAPFDRDLNLNIEGP